MPRRPAVRLVSSSAMAKPNLRLGVIAAVRRPDGRLLAFERTDLSGEWQLPQGGVENGESLEQAVWRELGEETGLTKKHVQLVEEHDEWTVYLWPRSMWRGDRVGQAHRWFFFEPIVDPLKPVPDGKEFCGWKWMKPKKLIDRVVDFRREPYERVLGG